MYALGFYVDAHAARRELGKEFGCLPPASLEHNQALAERAHSPQTTVHSIHPRPIQAEAHKVKVKVVCQTNYHAALHAWP